MLSNWSPIANSRRTSVLASTEAIRSCSFHHRHLVAEHLRSTPVGLVARQLPEAAEPAHLVAQRHDHDARPELAAILAHTPSLHLCPTLPLCLGR
jgi:hypothetical protein